MVLYIFMPWQKNIGVLYNANDNIYIQIEGGCFVFQYKRHLSS